MKKRSKIYYLISILVISTSLLLQSTKNVLAAPIPKPQIDLTHSYDYDDPHVGYTYEHHGLGVRHYLEEGSDDPIMTILAGSRKYISEAQDKLRYSLNIRTWYIEMIYLAQFTFHSIKLLCLGEEIIIDLVECESFGAYLTDTIFDDDSGWYIPENIDNTATFHCVYFFNDIALETYGNGESKISMEMDHKITLGNGVTEIKIDVIMNTEYLRIFLPSTQQEVTPGTEFTLEIEYTITLQESDTENDPGDTVPPSEITDTEVIYEVTDDEGNPITTNTLEMGVNFKDYYAISSYYSRQASSDVMLDPVEGNFAYATHSFPGLTYGTIIKMHSDPRLTVYHEGIIDESQGPAIPGFSIQWILIFGLIFIIMGLFKVFWKRRNIM